MIGAKKEKLYGILAATVLFLVRNPWSDEVINKVFTGSVWRFIQSTVNILSFVGLCFVTFFSILLIISVLTNGKS
ncbi:hypothetical protein SAMN04487895_102396 [Paenibacillus sophorae]|uniref:Uncharacterized protein n=1 Tax=Paenibacillus sophorae TaxID=1333845 RepID=A0A1H8J0E3_9BACL|nr:hypothetical protein [Paenibacillus sophorae]QWU16139.1 hypothetical protein KP014_02370 [Paenibacillus sophorae]SEN73637.1 hypothetical protein SAMN04487895_102396 [Paenibacillus sophorae]